MTNFIDVILPSVRTTGRKQILKEISHELAQKAGVREQILYDRLLKKSMPSECFINNSVMIVDMKINSLDKAVTAFARLSQPYDFLSPDAQPVSFIVVLVSPEREAVEHLQNLASWSRRMRDDALCVNLNRAQDADDIYLAFAAHTKPLKQAA